MDEQAAWELNDMNRRFYATQSAVFSRTRNNSWPGWQRCLEAACGDLCMSQGATLSGVAGEMRVLDAACGNLRFEAWMRGVAADVAFSFFAIDNCESLLPDEVPEDVEFHEKDLMDGLLGLAYGGERPTSSLTERGSLLAGAPFSSCDLAVSFGFMHHIPGAQARVLFVDELLAATSLGGHVAVSFWRFADDEGMLARAQESTAETLAGRAKAGEPALNLDANDYLLGFDQAKGVSRYCHSFSTAEIDALIAALAVPCEVVDRFRADGRTGALNEYIVLQHV